ncbi:predicted protein [Naegleria gruberi]|uniref:Predicted protein n=1 Tax=Naegleria gruberi TaxID=5762 RepID=D2V587_NAEGR|nr:uncharacterized protein NAEGRDRAFT_64052 [Naegleria gruberi]EFC48231.1 predicted protein [Naegleria gruberi]|eukprot:XP_002680975.1 predicted protein [Naegleria gruberi strain NEG-M]
MLPSSSLTNGGSHHSNFSDDNNGGGKDDSTGFPNYIKSSEQKRLRVTSLDVVDEYSTNWNTPGDEMVTTTYKRSIISPFLIYLIKSSGLILDFPDQVLFGPIPKSSLLLGPNSVTKPTANTCLLEFLRQEQVDFKSFLPPFLSLFFKSIKEQPGHFSSIATFTKMNEKVDSYEYDEMQDVFVNGFRNSPYEFNPNNTVQPNEVDTVFDFLHDCITHECIGTVSCSAYFVITELVKIMSEMPKTVKSDYDIEICKRYLSFINNMFKSICTYSIKFATQSASRKSDEHLILETLVVVFRVMIMFLSTNHRSCNGRDEELKHIVNDLVYRVASMMPFYKLMNLVHSLTTKHVATQFPLSIIQDLKVKTQKLRKMLSMCCENARSIVFLQHLPVCDYSHAMQYNGSSSKNDINFKFGLFTPKRGSTEWIRKVQRLSSALSQHICCDAFEVIPALDKKFQYNTEKKNQEELEKCKTNFTKEMLHEAVVLRVLQLLDEKDMYPAAENIFTDVSKGIIGKWILLANQMYAFITRKVMLNMRIVLFGEDELSDSTTLHHKGNFINISKDPTVEASYQLLSIRKCVELYGDHMKDHFIIWLLLQVHPVLEAKRFFDDPLCEREFIKLVQELKDKNYTKWRPSEEELINTHYSYILLRRLNKDDQAHIKEFEEWRNTYGKNLYNLDEIGLKRLFLLSSYFTKPSSDFLIDFLKKPDLVESIKTIPNDSGKIELFYPFEGKIVPLSVNMILVLSVHARHRLFDSLCDSLKNLTPPQPKTDGGNSQPTTTDNFTEAYIPPAIVETLSRTLYCLPFAVNNFKDLLEGKTRSNHCNYVFLEIINFRLMRYLRYFGGDIFFHLYIEIYLAIGNTTLENNHHRLYLLLENFCIKAMLYLITDSKRVVHFFDKNASKLPPEKISETFKRTLISACMKVFKLSPIKLTNLDKSKKVLQRLVSVCGKTVEEFGKLTSKTRLYPDFIKTSFENIKITETEAPSTVAQQKNDPKKPEDPKEILKKVENLCDSFWDKRDKVSTMKNLENIPHSNYLLCAIWSRVFEKEFSKEKVAFWKKWIPMLLPPRLLVDSVYKMINHVLDEFLSEENESGDQDESIFVKVKQVSSTLTKLIWEFEFLPLETVCLALIDRAKNEDPNLSNKPTEDSTEKKAIEHKYAHNILLLIITDNQFSKRVDLFLDLNRNPNLFDVNDNFTAHHKYHSQYPEGFGAMKTDDFLNANPSYYNNICLRMIPILDLICRRLCELNLFDFLRQILDKYGGLFAYHDYPMTFVKELLLYYVDLPIEIKEMLFTIICKNEKYLLSDMDASFSAVAKSHFGISVDDSNFIKKTGKTYIDQTFDLHYFLTLITNISEVLPTIQEPRANHTYINPKHIFYEFSNTFELRLNAGIIEVMCLPLTLQEIISKLVDCLIQNTSVCPPHQLFKCSYTTGLFLASLPNYSTPTSPSVSDCLFAILMHFLHANPHPLLVNDLENTHEMGKVVKTPSECLLCILQTFLYSSGHESFISLRKFLAKARKSQTSKLETREQFYMVCRLLAPFIPKLHSDKWTNSDSGPAQDKEMKILLESSFQELVLLFLTIEWDVCPEIILAKKRKYSTVATSLFKQNDGDISEDEMLEQILYFFQHLFHILYSTSPPSRQQFLTSFYKELDKCTNTALKVRLRIIFTQKEVVVEPEKP